ncbi:putative membrane protein [Emiliania huxleyi virus 145]|nr:putative membrane protein [Emiliania huxleyi virus 145]AHA55814.1 putative membrane protein [Emiliania huxleyi virus 164]
MAMNTSLYLPTEMTVGSIIFLIIYVIFMTDFIIKSKDYSISEGNLLHQDDGYNLELPSPLGLPETWQIEFSYSGTDQVQLFGIASDDTLQPNQHRESLNYITLERKDTNTVWLTVMHDGKHKIQIDIGDVTGDIKFSFSRDKIIYWKDGAIQEEHDINNISPLAEYTFIRTRKMNDVKITTGDGDVLFHARKNLFSRLFS